MNQRTRAAFAPDNREIVPMRKLFTALLTTAALAAMPLAGVHAQSVPETLSRALDGLQGQDRSRLDDGGSRDSDRRRDDRSTERSRDERSGYRSDSRSGSDRRFDSNDSERSRLDAQQRRLDDERRRLDRDRR
jgi:hypothetical protein